MPRLTSAKAHPKIKPEFILADKDKRLGRIIEQVGEFKPRHDPMQSPFEALAQAIVYQQLSGKAAATIYSRVKALFPEERELKPMLILETSDQVLRAAGLSQNKMLALKDLSLKAASGMVPEKEEMDAMEDEELIERLTAIRGIGRWTVEMLLIFRLLRLDVLPSTDYGIRKGFAFTYKLRLLPTPAQIIAKGEKWRPYRSVASWYLWRSLELQ